MLRKFSTSASSFAISMVHKKLSTGSLADLGRKSDLTRPEPHNWSPRCRLIYGPGPVPQFSSRKSHGFVVTHVPAVGLIYVQPNTKEVKEHLESLFAELESFGQNHIDRASAPLLGLDDIKVGRHYGVKSEEDGGFYRCEACDKLEGGKVKVFFLDHGNYELVNPSSLFHMPPDLENKRIHLLCIILQDVEPLFEEQCEGNQLRLEFLSWFRLRLNDKTIRATNLGEDNRSHIFIESERADINDEVKKKEDELRQRLKKLGADNKSSSGLVPNGGGFQLLRSSGSLSRQMSAPTIAPIAEEEADISSICSNSKHDEASCNASEDDDNSSCGLSLTFGEGFDSLRQAQKFVMHERAKEKRRRRIGVLLFKIEQYMEKLEMVNALEDAVVVKEVKRAQDILEHIQETFKDQLERVDALNIIEDSIINLNEATNKLKSDMDNQIEEAEANKQALQTEADEIVQLWQEVKSHRHYVNPDEKVAEPTTHLESLIRRYRSWSDERDHEIMDAQVNTKKCLSDFCDNFTQALDDLVREENESEDKKICTQPQKIDRDMDLFKEAVRQEREVLKRPEPELMAELLAHLDSYICDIISQKTSN